MRGIDEAWRCREINSDAAVLAVLRTVPVSSVFSSLRSARYPLLSSVTTPSVVHYSIISVISRAHLLVRLHQQRLKGSCLRDCNGRVEGTKRKYQYGKLGECCRLSNGIR